MRILVTGALGFIGRASMQNLMAEGDLVRPLDLKPQPDMWSGHIWVDLTNFSRIEPVFKGNKFDAVLHLAANASLQRSMQDPVYDLKNNILATVHLLSLCKTHGVPRFVFSSTSAVYRPEAAQPINEHPESLGPISPYGVSKAACEMYIRASGISYAILRYGNVYGPRQRAVGENCLIPRACTHFLYGEPFVVNGDGENRRDFVYINDVVGANVLALRSGVAGTFNIASGQSVSVNTVVRTVRTALASEAVIHHGPAKEGELREVTLDVRMAKKYLQWSASTPLAEGISRTAEWWLRHGRS